MTSDTPKEKTTRLITDYISGETAMKRTSSMLSPPEQGQEQKKANVEETANIVNQDKTPNSSTLTTALEPILNEIKLLRDTVHADYNKLHSNYTRLEELITKKSTDVEHSLNTKISHNTKKIMEISVENTVLKKENMLLKERLCRVESQQMKNNIIISGVAETKWEPYEITKTRVYETIASTLSNRDLIGSMEEAAKIDIVCCN